jgi:hypothetical protein
MAQTIRESTWGEAGGPMRVDREKLVILGVKCLGRESLNHGRIYSDQALDDAKGFYEGISVNVDHPSPDSAHVERSIAAGFGVLRNARVLEGGVYADIHYLDKHALTEVILERAERFPANFGMSHNATGAVSENRDQVPIVESLQAVESVDIVSRPATTAGLFESQERPVFGKKKKQTLRSVLEDTKDYEPAAKLLKLLEEEAFATTGDAELDVADEASSEDRTAAAFREMMIAALDDKQLDQKAKLSRIKDIMKSQEKLTGKTEEPSPEEPMSEDTQTETTTESLRTEVLGLISDIDRKGALRELLEDHDLRRSDLNASQRKAMGRAEDVEEMESLLEQFNIKPATGPKPAMGSARGREEADESLSYADCRESVRGKPAA